MPDTIPPSGEARAAIGPDVGWVILQRIGDLQRGQDELRAEVAQLRHDHDELRAEVGAVAVRMEDTRAELAEVKSEVRWTRQWALGLLAVAVLGVLTKLLVPGL